MHGGLTRREAEALDHYLTTPPEPRESDEDDDPLAEMCECGRIACAGCADCMPDEEDHE